MKHPTLLLPLLALVACERMPPDPATMSGEDVAVNLAVGECLARTPGQTRSAVAIDPRKQGVKEPSTEIPFVSSVYRVPSRTGDVVVGYSSTGCIVRAKGVDVEAVARRVETVLQRPEYGARRQAGFRDDGSGGQIYEADYDLRRPPGELSNGHVDVTYYVGSATAPVSITVDRMADAGALMKAQGVESRTVVGEPIVN